MKQTAIDYKKNIAGRFVLVEGAKLKQRVEGEKICVTRKIDGHLQILLWKDGKVTMLNSSGNEKAESLKCLDAFAEAMKKAGLKSSVVAAELYMPRDGGRPRCGDVPAALADNAKKDQLRLAPFDIVEIDGEAWKPAHYADTHKRLCELFADEMVKPVEMKTVASVDEVQEVYDQWVVEEGAEGLVVHSESSMVWKVKPRHTIDAAVIGYTAGADGIRDLMFAARHENGDYQLWGHGSNGMSDEDRKQMAERLSTMHVDSQYVLSDSRGIAYQMVRPEIVFEVSVLELVARKNDDTINRNPLLKFDEQQGWLLQGIVSGVSALGLTVVQERKDKKPTESDIRVSQLTDICPFEETAAAGGAMEKSTLLERKVYKKVSGEKVMLHKFLLWKTNKEQSGRYPAYVVYHTDYSSGRKDLLKRDMLYTNDEQQAREMLAAEIADNVKKGWEEVA